MDNLLDVFITKMTAALDERGLKWDLHTRDEEFDFLGIFAGDKYILRWRDETNGEHEAYINDDGESWWTTSTLNARYRHFYEMDFNVLTGNHEDIMITLLNNNKKEETQ